MRLFIAAELPDELIEALSETQAALRQCVSGRFVGADLFHVTLAFLGNVDAWRVGDLANLLDDAVARQTAFAATLGELGFFGRQSKAALWQGFTDKTGFASLAQSVRAALAHDGFDFDNKGFLPHVTLMRNADLTSGALPMPAIDHGVVDTVTLFSSDLSGERPVYEPLHRVWLETHH